MANEEPNKESVLDQVISIDKQDKADTPVSAVAALIQQRDELKKQIESRIAEDSTVKPDDAEEGSVEGDGEDGDGGDDDMSFDDDMDMDEDAGDEASDSSKDDKDDSEKDDKADEEKQKKEDEQAEKDKAKEEADKAKDEESAKDLDKTATECLTLIRKDASLDYFTSVKQSHAGYLAHASRYAGIRGVKTISLEEQPIVYTKDKVLESLKAVVGTVAIYSKSIQQVFNTMTGTLKGYVEQATYYDEYAKSDKVSFTNKLVDDKDVLLALAVAQAVDVKSSIRSLYKYNGAVVTLSKTVLSNTLESLPGSFQTAGFAKDEAGTEFSYKDKLPGFTAVKANTPVYENYLRTKVEQYNVYSLNISKTFDYYNTTSLGLDKVEDLKLIIDYSLKLITSLAVVADNMRALDKALQTTLDKVKVKIFDVENGKVQDLSTLGLDEVLQDVIKLKLVIESSLVTVKLNNKFLVSLFRYLKVTVALK